MNLTFNIIDIGEETQNYESCMTFLDLISCAAHQCDKFHRSYKTFEMYANRQKINFHNKMQLSQSPRGMIDIQWIHFKKLYKGQTEISKHVNMTKIQRCVHSPHLLANH